MGSFYFHLQMTFNKISARPGLLLLGSSNLGSLPGWQSLLGPGDGSSAPQSSLGKILPVPSLHHHGLYTVKAPPGAGLHGGRHQGLVGPVGALALLGCHDETGTRRGMRNNCGERSDPTYPLLSAVALMPTTLLLTRPLCLWVFLLVRLQGSVEKGFFTPRFFSRKLLLLRITAQAMSEETILDFTLFMK